MLYRSTFSVENIDSLQQQLIKGVYEESRTRFQIGKQDEDTLKIIMRSIFLQNSRNLPGNIQMQINELNKHVLDYAIPQIIGEAEAYIKYKNDVSTLAVPLSNQFQHIIQIFYLKKLGFNLVVMVLNII